MNFRSSHSVLGALGALGFSIALAPTASAQSAAGATETKKPLLFSQLSTLNLAPARLQLKSLDKGWQRMTVEGAENDSYAMYGGFRGPMYEQKLAEAGIGVYFTKGQSVTLGSEEFLVAYRIEMNMTPQDIQNLFRNFGGHGNETAPMGPRKFDPNSTLLLSLLNLRTIGNLKDVRVFDPKREIMGPADVIQASDENLQGLGRLLVQISQRNVYNMQRLPLRDAVTMRQTFDRYFHPRLTLFVHPQTKEAYRPNPILAKMPMRLISNRARVVAIHEARPGTDGKYGAVFLDGHTARVPQSQWKAVRGVLPSKPDTREIQRLSGANLRQLFSRLMHRARAQRGMLPSMQNASTLRRELGGYFGEYNAAYLSHPVTNEAYRPNALLHGKNLNQIANASRLVAFYEGTPDKAGKRNAVFLDGHIEAVAASNWNRVRSVAVKMKPSPR